MADVANRWLLCQQIMRVWQPALSASEFSVVMFVFDRTVGWGKLQERIPLRHFTHGVPKVRGGCGLSVRTIQRSLEGLLSKGALLRGNDPSGCRYSLNLEWEPPMRMIKEPKKPKRTSRGVVNLAKGGSQIDQGCGHIGQAEGGQFGLYKKEEVKTELQDGTNQGAARSTVEAVLEQGKARVETKRVAARSRQKPKPTELQVLWDAVMREQYPEATIGPWSAKVKAQIKWLRDNVQFPDTTLGGWLEWIVCNWDQIRAAKFPARGARSRSQFSAPEIPDIGFVIGLRDAFIEAWSARSTLRADVALTGDERLVRSLRRRGLTQEEAEAEAGAVREARTQEDALTAERVAIARERQMLDVQRARGRTLRPVVPSTGRSSIQIDFDSDRGIQPIEGGEYDET